MKVILRKNFENLGQIGDLIDVKDGYAWNYLIPKQIAYLASDGNIRALEEEKIQLAKNETKEFEKAKLLSTELEKISITIPVKVGDEDKLFGSVTTQMIADSLKDKGFDIDKRKIEISEQIKSLGIYSVNVKLHSQVGCVIKTWVVRE